MMQDLLALDNVTTVSIYNPGHAANLKAACPWVWTDLGLDELHRVTTFNGSVPVSFLDHFADTLVTLTNTHMEYHSQLKTWPNLETYSGTVGFSTIDSQVPLPLKLRSLTLNLPYNKTRGHLAIEQIPVDGNCALTSFTYNTAIDSPIAQLPPCVKNVLMGDMLSWVDSEAAVPNSIESIVALGTVDYLPYESLSKLDRLSNLQLRLNDSIIESWTATSTLHASGPLSKLRLELTSATDNLEDFLCDVLKLDEDLVSLEIYTDEIWDEDLPSCLVNFTALNTLVWPFSGISVDSIIALPNTITSLSIEVPQGFNSNLEEFATHFSSLKSLSLISSANQSSHMNVDLGSLSSLVNLKSFEVRCENTTFGGFFLDTPPSFWSSLTNLRFEGCERFGGELSRNGLEKIEHLSLLNSGFHSWPLVNASLPSLRTIEIIGCDDFQVMPDADSFASMTQLTNVVISSTVQGSLPPSVFDASSSVVEVVLSVSSGSLPARIDNQQLRTLNLKVPAGSRLPELTLPSALFNVTIANSGVIGSIPASWKGQWFAKLDLSNNPLAGQLDAPPSFEWPDNVLFTRYIPFATHHGSDSQQIILSGNKFTGPMFNLSNYPASLLDLSNGIIDMCSGNKSTLKPVWSSGLETCILSNVSCACAASYASCVHNLETTCPGSSPIIPPVQPPTSLEDCYTWEPRAPIPIIVDPPMVPATPIAPPIIPLPPPITPITPPTNPPVTPFAPPVDPPFVPVAPPIAPTAPIAPPTSHPIAPIPTPHALPPSFTAPIHEKPCNQPRPQPTELFECSNGLWITRPGNITTTAPIRIVGFQTVHVNGNLIFPFDTSVPRFIFEEGLGQLVIGGCMYGNGFARVEVILNDKMIDKLYNASVPAVPTLITSTYHDKECPKGVDLKFTQVTLKMADGAGKSCKRIEGRTAGTSTHQTLTLLLEPDHSTCNIRVLLPLFGFIGVLLAIVALIVFCWWRQRRTSLPSFIANDRPDFYPVDSIDDY